MMINEYMSMRKSKPKFQTEKQCKKTLTMTQNEIMIHVCRKEKLKEIVLLIWKTEESITNLFRLPSRVVQRLRFQTCRISFDLKRVKRLGIEFAWSNDLNYIKA